MRDLLVMYDNSSYLDKLLGTSFFNRKSYHFRVGTFVCYRSPAAMCFFFRCCWIKFVAAPRHRASN